MAPYFETMKQILAAALPLFQEIENEEELLVVAGAEKVRPQPCSTTDHLPKLRFGSNDLEEDEIDDGGHDFPSGRSRFLPRLAVADKASR